MVWRGVHFFAQTFAEHPPCRLSVQGIRDSKWEAHTVCPPRIKGQQESCAQRSAGIGLGQLEEMPQGRILKVSRKK